MRGHLAYLSYVLRHKWFVFVACFQMKVPTWRALIHDWHKFLPKEFWPYSRSFYNRDGSKRNKRDATGAYDPTKVGGDFDLSWLSHQRAKHHWQGWASIGDGGTLKSLPIPEVYLREMVADWIGAGRAQGKCDPLGWWMANGSKMILHEDSRVELHCLVTKWDATHGGK